MTVTLCVDGVVGVGDVSDLEQELASWFAGRIPDDWFANPPEIEFDREEIMVLGLLCEPETPQESGNDSEAAACASRIGSFRTETRDRRSQIAEEAEHLFNRKVSWGVICGERKKLFTNLSIPVMTRLRMQERMTLDTLIDSGVARSRSDALSWCVRLVSQNESDWLADLREALTRVEHVRSFGPDPDTG